MKYNWNKERIEAIIKDCDSLSQVLDKLNIPRADTKQDWKKLYKQDRLISYPKIVHENNLTIIY